MAASGTCSALSGEFGVIKNVRNLGGIALPQTFFPDRILVAMTMKADFSFFLARDLGVQKLKELLGDAYESDAPDQSEDSEGLHRIYASEFAFHNVEDGDGISAIPGIFGIEKPERDEPYGPFIPTNRNFVRIYIMQQMRIEMSRRPKINLKELSKAFESLPMELFFEILSHFQPIDLYNFCVAGHPFCSFLVGSQASEPIWRNSYRASDHSIPPPPPQVSGFRWAHLLFGSSLCTASTPGSSRCNRRGAVVDFSHCHRVCRACWLKWYITKYEDPDYEDHPVWTLVPTSRRRMGGPLSCWVRYSDDRYYQPEVQKHLSTLKVKPTEEGFRQRLERLKADAGEREKFAKKCRTWSDGIIDLAHQHSRTRSRKPRLDKKLTQPEVDQKLREKLTQCITKEIHLVRTFLDLYLQTYSLSISEFLPTPNHIMTSEPIYSAMIGAITRRMKDNEAESGGGYETYSDQLSDLILRWQDDRRSHYADKIPRSWAGSSLSNPVDDIFTLATSVFECLDCPTNNGKKEPWQAGRALIGWRAINGHFACPHRNWEDKLEFSGKGAQAAMSLATLAGLNTQTPLSSDLDSLDHRFTCANCGIAPTGYRGYQGHNVWTWRQCVYHFTQMNRVEDPDHQTPRWNRLSTEMAAYFKRREISVDVRGPGWCCLHCPDGCGITKGHIIYHLTSSHQIQIPRADVDYKYTMRAPSFPQKAIGLLEYPTPAQYCCLRCERPQSRMYAHRDIIPHLLDKHGIGEVKEGREYACIPLYDAHYP
ncbi:hypothetical protein BDN72DRAFT_847153 [Pluteus cervinus]|uniref:Uncharacterized protein n=1 Tax=Pluteus cervinus TaxID=181527 RepID=A0ACD3AEF2_9AGAR|nr:hypothetical protein BDN72DRAFT_847153 [Pluteus cervinus]